MSINKSILAVITILALPAAAPPFNTALDAGVSQSVTLGPAKRGGESGATAASIIMQIRMNVPKTCTISVSMAGTASVRCSSDVPFRTDVDGNEFIPSGAMTPRGQDSGASRVHHMTVKF